MKIILLWVFLTFGIVAIGGIAVLSEDKPLLEEGFAEIITRVYVGGLEIEEAPLPQKEIISQPTLITSDISRESWEITKTGIEEDLDVSVEIINDTTSLVTLMHLLVSRSLLTAFACSPRRPISLMLPSGLNSTIRKKEDSIFKWFVV